MATLNVDDLAGAGLGTEGFLGIVEAFLKTTTGKGVEAMMEEAVEAEVATDLDTMAEEISRRIELANATSKSPLPVSLMLTEPLSLTVKKAGKPGDGYSKKSHTGGEEFQPIRCYAGKRGALIYVFKPLAVADYVEMEMTEAQAKKSLSGFELWLKGIVDADLERSRKEAQQASSLKAEREKLADRAEQYADKGFGSW